MEQSKKDQMRSRDLCNYPRSWSKVFVKKCVVRAVPSSVLLVFSVKLSRSPSCISSHSPFNKGRHVGH